MSDQQVRQAAQQAWRDIARMHEHALHAVWNQYPAPQPHRERPESEGPTRGQASRSAERDRPGRHWPSESGPQ